METTPKFKSKYVALLCGLALLAAVGFADFATGYKVSLLIFYFLPILYTLKRAGLGFAFAISILAALIWLAADLGAGDVYTDYLTPVWNTGIRLSIFLLVVILFSTREQLQRMVEKRTESLRAEIQERIRLERELLDIVDTEQRRIGHDLHDSLGQHLTAIAFGAKIMSKKLTNKSLVEPASADRLVSMAEESIEMTRSIARNLHPVEFGADGLEVALQNLSGNLSKSFTVHCRFQHSGTVVLNDSQAGIHLYRIAQEAASNAVRHGHARNLVISLDAVKNSVMLTVTDDGSGLPPAAQPPKGMGLRIMNYRARIIGATFDIQNLPSGGAKVVCILDKNPPSL